VCVCGGGGVEGRWDFNVVRYPTERMASNRITSDIRDFSDFIFSLGLVDLPPEGGRFT
jgi:hypothetical protein